MNLQRRIDTSWVPLRGFVPATDPRGVALRPLPPVDGVLTGARAFSAEPKSFIGGSWLSSGISICTVRLLVSPLSTVRVKAADVSELTYQKLIFKVCTITWHRHSHQHLSLVVHYFQTTSREFLKPNTLEPTTNFSRLRMIKGLLADAPVPHIQHVGRPARHNSATNHVRAHQRQMEKVVKSSTDAIIVILQHGGSEVSRSRGPHGGN